VHIFYETAAYLVKGVIWYIL